MTTQPCNAIESALLDILRRGASWSAQEIAAELHTTQRRVRALVQHFRQDHRFPVCSTPATGFFLPRDRAAVAYTIASMKSRLSEQQATLRGVEDGVEEWFGQMGLPGVESVSRASND